MLKKLALIGLLFLGAFLLIGWMPSLNPFAHLFGEGKTKVTASLPKVSLEKLSELVTLRVNTDRVVDGKNDHYKAIYIVGGDALIGTDLKKAKIDTDPTTKKMTITLQEPRPC